jgi:protein-disulfide isomerase
MVSIGSSVLENRPLDIVFGDHNASLEIYMYSSYSCSYCSLFFTDVFPKIKNKYIDSGKVKLIMRLTVKSSNVDVQDAMKAAVCISKYGNYEYLHELLLTDSKVVATHEFRDMINDFINRDVFVAECILGQEAEEYLNQNLTDFNTLGLKGTPTFIVGNRIYTGFQDFEKFDKIIENNLNE